MCVRGKNLCSGSHRFEPFKKSIPDFIKGFAVSHGSLDSERVGVSGISVFVSVDRRLSNDVEYVLQECFDYQREFAWKSVIS